MTKIQLFGDVTGNLDVNNEINVPLTFSISEIRDITKRSGFFSKTITLPGTANNNVLLGYYFDVNLAESTFNINRIQQCAIIQEGAPVLNNAYLQLTSVRKRQNVQTGDDIIEYDVIVKDQISNFFTTINNKELKDLDFSELNHNYTSANIALSFSHNWTDGYKYVLPFRDQAVDVYESGDIVSAPGADILNVRNSVRGYYTNELFPAIYIMEYWKKIHEQAGFTYEFVDFDEYLIGADKLLITDNTSTETLLREVNEFISIEAKIAEEDNVSVLYSLPIDNQFFEGDDYNLSLYLSDDIRDANNKWTSILEGDVGDLYPQFRNSSALTVTPSTQKGYSIWESEFILSQARPKISVSLDYAFSVYNTSSTDFARFVQGNPSPYFKLTFQILDVTGAVVASQQLQNINMSTTPILPLTANSMFSTAVPVTFEFLLTNGDIGSLYAFRLFLEPIKGIWPVGDGSDLQLQFTSDGLPTGNPVDVIPTLLIRSAKINISYEAVPYNATFPINSVIPSKIKQSDFIKSIVTMYNLYCIVDKDEENKLIWKRRDQFYDEGPTVDWTYKLDRSQFQDVVFLPELTAKKFIFTYKQDDDFANETYFRATREIYGQQEVVMSSEWVKDIDTKEIIFSPTPMSWTDLGIPGVTLIQPYISLNPGDNEVRILYDGGEQELGLGNDIYLIDTVAKVDTAGYLLYIDDILQTNPPSSVNILDIAGYSNVFYTQVSTYPLTTHCSSAYGGPGSIDINFGVCDFYLFPAFQPTQNNLYNLNWKRTLDQLDNSKLLTAYFNLTPLDIASLDLSCKVKCMNNYWYINKIIDYDCNSKNLTKVELISIDVDVKLY